MNFILNKSDILIFLDNFHYLVQTYISRFCTTANSYIKFVNKFYFFHNQIEICEIIFKVHLPRFTDAIEKTSKALDMFLLRIKCTYKVIYFRIVGLSG